MISPGFAGRRGSSIVDTELSYDVVDGKSRVDTRPYCDPTLLETVLVGTNWLLNCGPWGVEGVRGVLGDESKVGMELPVQHQVNKMVCDMIGNRGSESVGQHRECR